MPIAKLVTMRSTRNSRPAGAGLVKTLQILARDCNGSMPGPPVSGLPDGNESTAAAGGFILGA